MLPTTRFVLLLTFLSPFSSRAQDTSAPDPGAFEREMASQVEEADGPLYQPLVERYVLDELRALRQDMQGLRVELIEKVTSARLDASDRAIRYTADTTNNIFYIITAAASILLLLGWRSLRDIRKNIESITAKKLAELTEEYEARLHEIERKMKLRSEQIMAAHEEISKANLVHSLWMRAALEKSAQEKVNLYDQILEIKPDDVEALTYKADALLEMEEVKWALSLADQAIAADEDYALAYWQRACAHALLGQEREAIADLERAVDLSETLRDELAAETAFDPLREKSRFRALMASEPEPAVAG